MDMIFDLLMQFVPEGKWLSLITAIIALASAICALTPTPDPNTLLGKLYKLIEILALNVGKSKQTGSEKFYQSEVLAPDTLNDTVTREP